MIQDILLQAKYIPRVVLLAILLAITYLYVKEKGKKTIENLIGLLKKPWLMAFIVYTAYIVTSTLLARQVVKPYIRVFDSIGFRGDPVWDKEIIENILFFVPYTFLYLQAFRPENVWTTALKLSIITTVAIELSQLVFWLGFFQVADMLHNIIGGMIGCGLWYLIMRKNKT